MPSAAERYADRSELDDQRFREAVAAGVMPMAATGTGSGGRVDGMYGEIRLFAGGYAPVNWAFCDGSLVQIAQNMALFSLMGTHCGGDGQTTFALPDIAPLPSTGPAGGARHHIICTPGTWPQRDQ